MRQTSIGQLHVREKRNSNEICIVFIHGLGGQSSQFDPLFDYFGHTYHVIALDLFGHGKSEDPSTYDLEEWASHIAPLLPRKKMILVAHSMGCAVAVYLQSQCHTIGLFLIGSKKVAKTIQASRWQVELWRWWHRLGGTTSPSVCQFVHYPTAPYSLLVKQLEWNKQSRTSTLMGLMHALKWPTMAWHHIKCPVWLVCGEFDRMTPLEDTMAVYNTLKCPKKAFTIPKTGHNAFVEHPGHTIALLTHFFAELDILCQPPSQSKESKLDNPYALKNYKKWKQIQPVSEPLFDLLAMKIPRENDEDHSPQHLIERGLGLIVDMSHNQPPYDTSHFSPIPAALAQFHRSPLEYDCIGSDTTMYIKQSFISKVPPSHEAVMLFVSLLKAYDKISSLPIGIHCHYGFNRTGFMMIAALHHLGHLPHVFDGIEWFAQIRPPGIKHQHFKDVLLLRYATLHPVND